MQIPLPSEFGPFPFENMGNSVLNFDSLKALWKKKKRHGPSSFPPKKKDKKEGQVQIGKPTQPPSCLPAIDFVHWEDDIASILLTGTSFAITESPPHRSDFTILLYLSAVAWDINTP